jgi:hypothetical protein
MDKTQLELARVQYEEAETLVNMTFAAIGDARRIHSQAAQMWARANALYTELKIRDEVTNG